MIKTRVNTVTKNMLMSILATLMIFLFSECSQKITFLNSSVVPAANGYVKLKRDQNKNYVIRIRLSNLADPSRLSPPKQTYVVWILTDREVTKNMGQIQISSNLSAAFETVSAFKPVKIFITAENDPGIQTPGYPIVITTNDF